LPAANLPPTPAFAPPGPAFAPPANAPSPPGYAAPQPGGYGYAPPPAMAPMAPIAAPGDEDKTVAILAYITLLGFIAALIIHGNKKTQLGAFHLRQALGYFLTALVGGVVVGVTVALVGVLAAFLGLVLLFIPAIYGLYGLAMLVLWIFGLISAIGGQMKPMPVVGPLYQKWFGSAFQ